MTWQDELRRLDEELAAGRISAAEYRARRDQVVSAAANPGAPAQNPNQPPPQATQMVLPVGPPSPPQGQPQLNQPPPQNAEATQVVSGRPPQGEPERTQMVNPNSWQGQRGGPQQPQGGPGEAERTQVVPGVGGGYPPQGNRPGMQSPPGGFPQQQFPQQPPQQQQQPGWGEEDELAPPWGGGGDFPPLVPQASDAWLKQGPEVFEDGKSNTGRIVLIVVAVVVLAGLGVGAYLLWGRSTPNGPAPSTAAPPAATTTSKPPDPLAIGKIPGQDSGKTVKNFNDVQGLNYLTQPEVTAYEQASPTSAEVEVNTLDGGTAVVLNVQAGSVSSAQAAVTALVQDQVTNHAQAVSSQPPGVQVTQVGNVVRGHYYTSKGVIVRVEMQGSSPEGALADFDKVLAAQLKVAKPANE